MIVNALPRPVCGDEIAEPDRRQRRDAEVERIEDAPTLDHRVEDRAGPQEPSDGRVERLNVRVTRTVREGAEPDLDEPHRILVPVAWPATLGARQGASGRGESSIERSNLSSALTAQHVEYWVLTILCDTH